MALGESQCKYLRGLGHALKPIVHVGAAGLTDAVVAELDSVLEHHELVKVRVRAGDRVRRDAILELLVSGSGSELVQRVGNVALLYRAAAKPRLILP